MTEYTTCEIFLCIDANGDYAVGPSEEQAIEAYENEIGGGLARIIRRLVVKAPRPEVVQSGEVTLPEAPTQGPLEVSV